MKPLVIIGMSVLGAVLYGILHDQVTARICPEYFTVGHVDVGLRDPTLLGLFWGIVATWWAGLIVGIPLAFAARFGKRRKVEPRELVRRIGGLLLVMGLCAAVAGGLGYLALTRGWVTVEAGLLPPLEPSQKVPFVVDLCIHETSYFVGFAGAIVLSVLTWRARPSLTA
jgi:hypothetical protein